MNSPEAKASNAIGWKGGAISSMKKPGRNSMKQAAASSTASYHRTLTNIQPWVSELKARIASSDMTTTRAPCQMLSMPISSSSVLNRKTSGRMAVRNVVHEGLHAGLQRVGPGYGRGREGGKADGWRRIRQQAVIEDVEVDGDQRQDQSRCVAQLDQHARQQGGDHQVVGGGRQTHAENDAEDRGKPQQDVDIAAGDRLDDADHGIVEARGRDGAHDDAGGGDGDRDAHHVARAGHHADIDFGEAVAYRFAHRLAAAADGRDDPPGDDDRHHREDRVEDRAVRAPAFDHQQIDQDDDGDQVVRAAEEGRAQRRDLRAGQAGEAELLRLQMGDVEQRDIAERGGDRRGCDHLEIRDADELGDDEGGGSHDRRHELAVGRGRDLDGASLHRRHADPPHDGDREGAGGDDMAIEEPEIMPVMPDARIAALAGPPL